MGMKYIILSVMNMENKGQNYTYYHTDYQVGTVFNIITKKKDVTADQR